MRHNAISLLLLVGLTRCGGMVVQGDPQPGDATTDGNGVNVLSVDAGYDALPCEIASVLAAHCVSCHGPSLAGGAPFSLVTLTDLLDASPGYPGQTKAQRSLIRMQLSTMPPAPATQATVTELDGFKAWVLAGSPAGSCGTTGSGNNSATTTCLSNSYWTSGNRESSNMNPGLACQACHASADPGKAYFFMGTVFPSAHEKDTCNASPPAGLRVEFLDANDQVVLTLQPSSPSGNFRSSSRSAIGSNGLAIALPYRARVVNATGGSTMMQTPQTSGDCNACHTEQGVNGAPGRIVWPQ